MNREDLGNYFIKDNQLYVAIGYAEDPTMEIKNVITGQRQSIVIGSPYSQEFKKLVALKADAVGFYNLDSYENVKDVKLTEEELRCQNDNS